MCAFPTRLSQPSKPCLNGGSPRHTGRRRDGGGRAGVIRGLAALPLGSDELAVSGSGLERFKLTKLPDRAYSIKTLRTPGPLRIHAVCTPYTHRNSTVCPSLAIALQYVMPPIVSSGRLFLYPRLDATASSFRKRLNKSHMRTALDLNTRGAVTGFRPFVQDHMIAVRIEDLHGPAN
jgi:hypothetical protein